MQVFSKQVCILVSNYTYVSNHAFQSHFANLSEESRKWRDYASHLNSLGRLDPLVSRGHETLIINALMECQGVLEITSESVEIINAD